MEEAPDNRVDSSAASEELEATDPGPRSPGRRPPKAPVEPATTPVPDRIGPYRILGELGRGGMGIVYLAEQTHPVRRRVALKMLREGRVNRELQVRFEAERHAMARLHHPNVAQLFEAGSTDQGQPFFVMELVEGLPITKYCDSRRLRIRDRIELFRAVCEGVQHAHEKGLLHRDLKPANILVAEVNGRPNPKVLDFGIAKAIDQPLAGGTLLTGQDVVGTPAYLSPEAVVAVGGRFDLDTRSDIYALGVVLYELLIGIRPFETKGVPLVKRFKQITEEEPPGPSTRWTDLEEETRVREAETRGDDVASLPKRLQGDLDWIVLKAIAKDRKERYASASDLAADLRRHLRNEPVEASPPSVLYRLGKFVRRRRGVVLSAALLFLSLVLGLTGTLVNLGRANREAERANREADATLDALEEAEQISEFLQGLFEVSDPGEARGNSITAREILDRGAEEIRTGFEEKPLIRARFMLTIGNVYTSLGLYDQARPLLEEALSAREAELETENSDIAAALFTLGILNVRHGHRSEAEQLFRRSLEIQEKTFGQDHPEVARSLNGLAVVLDQQGRFEEAEALHRRALEIREKTLGPEHSDVASSLTNLAALYRNQARYEDAERLHLRALEIREKVQGPDHLGVAYNLNNLAILYEDQGRYEDAEPLYLRSLDIKAKALGSDHPQIAIGLNNIAGLYARQGRYEDAEEFALRSLEMKEKALGRDNPGVASTLITLAALYRTQGRHDDAEPYYRRALEIREASLPAGHPDLNETLRGYALLLRATGRETEALELEAQAQSHD